MRIKKFLKPKIIKKLPNLQISMLSSLFKKPKIHSNPPFIQIEPTTKCNLDCIMCPRKTELSEEELNKDMSFDNFKIILDKIHNVIILNIQGFGEPFLNKDIFNMIEYSKNKNIFVCTISNGLVLSKDKNKRIINSGLDQISFSIDGPTKNSYEKIRLGGNFNKVMKNISNLAKMRNKSNSNLKINLLAILNRENFDLLEKYIHITKNLGLDKLRIEQLYFDHVSIERNLESISLTESQKRNVTRKIMKIKKLSQIENIKISFSIAKDCYIGCTWPWMRLYINYDGSVSPCCNLPSYKIGNLLTENFNEVWNNKKIQNFRKLMMKSKPRICERVSR